MHAGKHDQKPISHFEDLIAWQKSRVLVREIYQITNKREFQRDFGLKDQIRRASVSVMSNIAEGFDRGSRAEFHKFLVIAKGSCAEVRSQTYVAYDSGYIDEQEFNSLMQKTTEVGKIIGGLRASVQRQRDTQNKR